MSTINNSLNNNSGYPFSSPNLLAGYSTTVTATSTTTLTVSSNQLQYFTGSSIQNCKLPVTSTLVLGQSYTIVNNSIANVTIVTSASTTVKVVLPSNTAVVTCILTSGTTAASWNVLYFPTSGAAATNIAGGVANDIPYQTAASTTGFIVPSNNAVLTTNGSGVPSWSTSAPIATIPIDTTTITSTGSVIQASGTFNAGLSTAPAASHTATPTFGTSATAGTAIQNTLGYDIMVNITVNVTSSTTATLVLGVGSTSTPTTDTVIPSFTIASLTPITFAAIVPNNYYLLVNSTGTIVISSILLQSCPL